MSLQESSGTLATTLPHNMIRMMDDAAEKLSTRNDPVAWISKNFFIPEARDDPEAKGRIVLVDYQKDVIREAFSKDDAGLFKYSVIVWSDIKKSAKSTIAAAVNLYRALHSEWGEFYVIANDLKQADSRVAHYIRRAIQLSPDLRSVCRMNGYRIQLPSGSFIEAIPIDPSGEAGSNADQISFSELWGANEDAKQKMWCLDDETEVLTLSGWKAGVDLDGTEKIAVYDDGRVVFEIPKKIFKNEYTGKMHSYQHKNFSLLCTPDHRLYGRYSYHGNKSGVCKYDVSGVMRSSELRNSGYGYYHPVLSVDGVQRNTKTPEYVYIPATKFHEEKYIPWKKWVAFIGLYLTEGSTNKFRGVPCHVRISQLREPHPEKYDRIYEILVDCFGDWVKIDKRDGFKISSTELSKILYPLGTTWKKRVPREIIESEPDELNAFIEAYVLGDGHVVKESQSVQITCASKGMADDIQEVLFRLGKRSSVRPHTKYWRVSILNGSFSVSVFKDKWQEVDYDGMVWCPVVSSGLFVARRDGRVFITGNSEMTLSPTKYGKSFRWIESYAGFSEEADLLYSLYETGVRHGQQLWPDRLYPVTNGEPTPLELYVNQEARMLCLWNTQPRCPWQTKEYYASEQSVLLPNEFLRMHRNQWVSSTETFVPMEWWDACGRDQSHWPTWGNCKNEINRTRFVQDRWPMIIALDAAVSGDTFGVWMGCRHPDFEEDVLTMYTRKWVPPKGGKLDFSGTEDEPGPEREIDRLIKSYNVVEVAYDPYQLHDLATRMKKKLSTWFRAFGQGNERLLSDSQFRDIIRDRRFWHRGELDLREHLQNADAKIDPEDRKVRIVKRSDRQKVDLAVCAAMGSYEVLRLNL